MGLKIYDNLTGHLENAGKLTNSRTRRVLKQSAEKLRDEARRRAPVDEGNLEESIRVEKGVGEGMNRRNVYYVGVDEDMPIPGRSDNKTVGDYAMKMHELHGIVYQPGPGTVEKQRANPDVVVGRKFLESAIEDLEPEIEQALAEAIRKSL